MARTEKYCTGIVGEIKHNIREFKDGKCPTNMEVDPERRKDNYSIIRRGKTAKEIEKYRKEIEKECFSYNRKNLVHANEVICPLPSDCPPEQEKQFFLESFKYICSTLPMGERCVFLAEVHADEGKVLKDGVTVVEGAKHLHVMYVLAVPDTKHENFKYKLCSDQLTRRSIFKQWHPNYQKWIDNAGIHATVASGVTPQGKSISVKSLKEITKHTGLSLEQIKSLEKENKKLYEQLRSREQELAASHETISKQDSIIAQLKDYISTRDHQIEALKEGTSSKEHDLLRELSEKDSRLKEAQSKLSEKDNAMEQITEKLKTLEAKQKEYEIELRSTQKSWERESEWGSNSGWGNTSNWGKDNIRTREEEHTW